MDNFEVIFKYPLQMIDNQIIKVPKGTEPLSVMVQNGQPCLWCKVDRTESDCFTEITVQMAGTGQPRNHLGKFISSFMLNDGEFVFHVFYKVG